MTLLVVGNVTEDIVFSLPRLPNDGETLIAESRATDIGGKGLNQALIAGRAGMAVKLIAPIGADAAGRRARTLVVGEPLEVVLIEKPVPTDQSIIAVGKEGENHIISTASAASALSAQNVIDATESSTSVDQILLQGNLSFETTKALLEWARAERIETTVNPSPIRWSYDPLWPLIDRVILNLQELAQLSGATALAPGIDALKSRGVGDILVTLGAQGAVLLSHDQQHEIAAASAHVIDIAGAGDTFCGMFLAALSQGCNHADAMKCAARAAAITIGRSGTWSAFPSTEELSELLASTGAGI